VDKCKIITAQHYLKNISRVKLGTISLTGQNTGHEDPGGEEFNNPED
jgi:hypothetical protein